MKRKGEITKDKILSAASQLALKKGFEATSINDLVEATGCKKGCLYFHFSGKRELSLAILENAKTEFMTYLEARMSGDTPLARLEGFFNWALEINRKKGFSSGCLFGNTALEMSDKDESITVFIKDFFAEWTGRIRKNVKAAQKSGDIRCDLSAEVLAGHIVMSLEGAIMLARLEKSDKPVKNCVKSLKKLLGISK